MYGCGECEGVCRDVSDKCKQLLVQRTFKTCPYVRGGVRMGGLCVGRGGECVWGV